MITWREELAWAAGLFDGEGWIGNHRRSTGRLQVRLVIPQIDRRVLDRFAAAVRIGKVFGPYDAKNRVHKQFRYVVTHLPMVQAVIGQIWKFLAPVKREQAAAALIAARPDAGVRGGNRQTCKRGHPFDEKNTAIYYQHGYRSRRCRQCMNDYMRELRKKKHA